MKNIRKWPAVLLCVILLCVWAIPLCASAVSVEDAVGLLIVTDPSTNERDSMSTALVSVGGKVYAFSPGTSESFKYQFYSPAQNVTVSMNPIGFDSNELIQFVEMTNTVNVPVLTLSSSQSDAQSGSLYVLYYTENQGVSSATVTISQTGEGLFAVTGAPTAAGMCAPVVNASGQYAGLYVTNGSEQYVFTSDYLYSELTGETNTATTASTNDTPDSPVDEVTNPYDDPAVTEPATETAGGTSGSGESGGGSKTVITVIVVAIIAGLIFLLARSKAKGNSDSVAVLPADDGTGSRICIQGQNGVFDGKKFELEGTVIIGRVAGRCNICYPADTKGVSGEHCQLRKSGDGIELIDLNSKFGTFVNGQRIAPNMPVQLKSGDRFYLASETNAFIVYR